MKDLTYDTFGKLFQEPKDSGKKFLSPAIGQESTK